MNFYGTNHFIGNKLINHLSLLVLIIVRILSIGIFTWIIWVIVGIVLLLVALLELHLMYLLLLLILVWDVWVYELLGLKLVWLHVRYCSAWRFEFLTVYPTRCLRGNSFHLLNFEFIRGTNFETTGWVTFPQDIKIMGVVTKGRELLFRFRTRGLWNPSFIIKGDLYIKHHLQSISCKTLILVIWYIYLLVSHFISFEELLFKLP